MNADSLARPYRWLEYAAFGRLLERCRFTFLDRLMGCRSLLLLGEGDGRFLAKVVERNPEIHIDVVDSSRAMLHRAEARLSERIRTHRVRFWHADLSKPMALNQIYDAVVTNFVLDCFDQEGVARLASWMRERLQPGGIWLISEFYLPSRGWRRFRAKVWLSAMYFFFRVTTGLNVRQLPDYPSALTQAGFHLRDSRTYSAGLFGAELWERAGE